MNTPCFTTEKPNRADARHRPRRGVIVVLSTLMTVAVLSMVTVAVDVGHMMVIRCQLQAAADSGAIAAAGSCRFQPNEVLALARSRTAMHTVGGRSVDETDAELGVWDARTGRFIPSAEAGNAIRVTARRTGVPGLLLGALGKRWLTLEVEAVAMVPPSGKEPAEPTVERNGAWATTLAGADLGRAARLVR